MIQKFIYGAPLQTEAVTLDIPAESGVPAYGTISTHKGFSFSYVMADDDIVYGLGEANRGINKRGTAISATVRMIRIIPKTSVPFMEPTISSSSRGNRLSAYFSTIPPA